MNSAIRFDGKTALITGAASGLGRSHAIEFARRRARVMLTDMNEAVQDVAAEIQAEGGECAAAIGSVSNRQDCERAVQAAIEQWGQLDILVNNAGVLRDRTLEKQSDADWDTVLDVHLTGARNMTLAAWPSMSARKYGRIINTTSASGLYGNFGQTNYAAAKMGLVGFTKSCALEGVRHGVNAHCIAPIAHTAMTDKLWDNSAKAGTDPALVSPVVAYLASSECRENCMILAAGGGYVARVAVIEALGARVEHGQSLNAEWVRENFARISDMRNADAPPSVIQALKKAFRAESTGEI
ncbi:MAG: short-chain dehydrogenase [Alphaproteobacteria bacterium]|nr:MAG: short-chain dehydrogenase [Alphaproteobacteria bacterium]